MFKNIYNILVTFLGESKQGCYSNDIEQYQFNCCRCAEDNGGISDGKHNLEVLLSSNKGLKYHCWKCGDTDNMRGNLGNLIKRYGGSLLYQQYKSELDSIKKTRLYDINLFNDNPNEDIFNESVIKLPNTYKNIDLKTIKYKKLTDYLQKRGITQDIIDKFKIGYTDYNDNDWTMSNKIIIPSYDSFGDLNFYVGRDFTGKSKLKYKNCNADKKNIIFQESLINWDADIYLVEGAIDCLFLPNSISLLGKSLTKDTYLYNSLIKKCNANIIICLDGDTHIDETKRIYSSLNFGRLKNKIEYVRLGSEKIPYKDFGDLYVSEGKKGIIKTIKDAKQFSEIDLIF